MQTKSILSSFTLDGIGDLFFSQEKLVNAIINRDGVLLDVLPDNSTPETDAPLSMESSMIYMKDMMRVLSPRAILTKRNIKKNLNQCAL